MVPCVLNSQALHPNPIYSFTPINLKLGSCKSNMCHDMGTANDLNSTFMQSDHDLCRPLIESTDTVKWGTFSKLHRPWLDCADLEADLDLHWLHTSKTIWRGSCIIKDIISLDWAFIVWRWVSGFRLFSSSFLSLFSTFSIFLLLFACFIAAF